MNTAIACANLVDASSTAPDIQSRYYSRASFPQTLEAVFSVWLLEGARVAEALASDVGAPVCTTALRHRVVVTLHDCAAFVVSKWALIATVGAYGVLNLGATVAASTRTGWRFFPLFPIAFTIIHLAYGAGFLVGIARFWNRWGDHTTRSTQPVLQERIGLL